MPPPKLIPTKIKQPRATKATNMMDAIDPPKGDISREVFGLKIYQERTNKAVNKIIWHTLTSFLDLHGGIYTVEYIKENPKLHKYVGDQWYIGKVMKPSRTGDFEN